MLYVTTFGLMEDTQVFALEPRYIRDEISRKLTLLIICGYFYKITSSTTCVLKYKSKLKKKNSTLTGIDYMYVVVE